MADRSGHLPSRAGEPTGSAIRRRYRAAPRVQLVGRSVRTLVTPADEVGDVSVTVARIEHGRMNAHRHAEGGEVMFVARGRGILWVEGLPAMLAPGTAAVAPEGVLHNAENTGAGALVVVGAFCPAAIAGSYAEEPPRFEPSGALTAVTGLTRRAAAVRPEQDRRTLRTERLVAIDALSPNIALRLVSIGPRATADLPVGGPTRAWVVVRGRGLVASPASAAGPIACFDLVAARSGAPVQVAAASNGLALVEFEAEPPR